MPVIAVLALLPAPQWAQSIRADAALFNGETIESSRPLVEVASILRARYGKLIAYEDPLWEWVGDDAPQDPRRFPGPGASLMATPVERVFRLPPELTGSRPRELTPGVLETVLAAYHRQYPVPRYRIVESKYGLHFVPETAHDAGGPVGPACNVMDTSITVEESTRTASEHFAAICQVLSQAHGFPVMCAAIGIREDWFEKLFGAPGGTLKWGASAVSARDALADLLDHSATSFSWATYCDRKTLPNGAPRCIVDLQYIRVARTDTNGKPGLARLEYDRRKK